MKVVHLEWSPNIEEMFATAGHKHVAVCTLKGNAVDMKRGKAAKGGD